MAHGQNAGHNCGKGSGYEYWKSRMPWDQGSTGRPMKRATHKYERRRCKRMLRSGESADAELLRY